MKTGVFVEMSDSGLRRLLIDYGVSIQTWGIGEAKESADLLRELNSHESFLRIKDDAIQRVVKVAKLLITAQDQPGKMLHEEFHMFKGRRRERNSPPSGKMGVTEDPFACAKRELKDELSLSEDQYTLQLVETREESRPSKSYPDLECAYELYFFDVRLNKGVAIQDGFVKKDEEGIELHFCWKELT